MTGARVGNWVLGAEIGRGPVGVVYRAVAADDAGRTAAVKLIAAEAARGADFAQRFPAEILALHRLNHPNVAKFYDSGVHAGTPYYASELVDGPDLGTLLRTRPKAADRPGLSWNEEVLSIAAQAARGLKHGHHRSLLHRGLKPSNLLLAADGTLKLTDFGVGRIFEQPPLALAPDPWGGAGFLAPEVFAGKPLTRRGDLYALGGVLYTLLAGRPPYAAASAAEFLHKHCYTLPDRPANFVPKLLPEFDELLCDLLAKDPNRRPASAAAVLEELDRVRGKLERKGVPVKWPPDPGDTTATLAPLPAGDGRAGPAARGDDRRPLMARPHVVVPLFLLVCGLLLAGVFWPRPSADELMEAARPLVASDAPADWDRAWTEYLDPLTRRYPDQYADEVQAGRARIADRRELRRAVDQGARARYKSEAERWYAHGLRLAQAGDAAGARRTWETVARGFGDAGDDTRWAKLATEGLAELTHRPPAHGPLPAEVERAKKQRDAGHPETLDALAILYRDDPAALELIRR